MSAWIGEEELREAAPPGFTWLEEADVDDRVPDHAGCECAAAECVAGACPCACARIARDERGRRLVLPVGDPAEEELSECGPNCACFGACGLGFSGVAAADVPVSLRLHPGKGWGVHADEALPAGLLVGQYAGEYVSNAEAQRRLAEYDAAGDGHALVVLREWLPSGTAAVRLNIDATHVGCLTRFLNHACDGGNLQLLLGRRTGCLLPRVLFATSRAVRAGEELTWSYGEPNAGPDGRPCFCRTPACLGYMPNQDC